MTKCDVREMHETDSKVGSVRILLVVKTEPEPRYVARHPRTWVRTGVFASADLNQGHCLHKSVLLGAKQSVRPISAG